MSVWAHPPMSFRHEAQSTIRLALPVIVGQWAAIAMNFVDTVMCGRYSATALAAVAVGGSLWSTAILFMTGVLLALPPSLAQLRGAGRYDGCRPVTWQVFWIGQGLAVLIMLLLLAAERLLVAVGIDPQVIPPASDYLRALVWGLPAFAGYQVLRFFNEGFARTRPGMVFGILGLGLNILGNRALIFGHWGLPELGVVGCGLTTTAVFWMQFVGLAIFTLRSARYRELALWRVERPEAARMKPLLRLGLPIGVTIFVEASLFSGVALLVGTLGAVVVAGHQVALNFAAITFMVPLGIGMASSIRVGEAVGRGDRAAARAAGMTAIALALGVQCMTATVMVTVPRLVARIYTADAAVIEVAAQLLLLAALFQLPDGIQVSSAGALRGLKDTVVPMLATLVAYWGVGLPLAYVLGFRLGWGAPGTWSGMIAGLATAALLLFWRFSSLSRRRPEETAVLA